MRAARHRVFVQNALSHRGLPGRLGDTQSVRLGDTERPRGRAETVRGRGAYAYDVALSPGVGYGVILDGPMQPCIGPAECSLA